MENVGVLKIGVEGPLTAKFATAYDGHRHSLQSRELLELPQISAGEWRRMLRSQPGRSQLVRVLSFQQI